MLLKNDHWIGADDNSWQSPMFTGTFSVGALQKATIEICGLGFFELYVNGARVGEDFFVPVYSNYDAAPYGDDVYSTLSKQMNNSVKWKDTIEKMIADGYTDFIETGAGKTLCGLIKKISTDVNVYSVEDAESLQKTVEAVKGNA